MAHRIINLLLLAGLLSAVTAVPVSANYRTDARELVEHIAVESMAKVWDIEAGELTEEATEELLAEAVERIELLPEDSEHKANLEAMAAAAAEELSKPKMHLYGNCVITHYCNGVCCCGQWAGGNTASGVPPTPWHTVAHNYLPFGTKVLIDGVVYTVEDRGDENMAGGDWFDIYLTDHNTANVQGMHKSEVWIIDE